jgi:hypothetical protein
MNFGKLFEFLEIFNRIKKQKRDNGVWAGIHGSLRSTYHGRQHRSSVGHAAHIVGPTRLAGRAWAHSVCAGHSHHGPVQHGGGAPNGAPADKVLRLRQHEPE